MKRLRNGDHIALFIAIVFMTLSNSIVLIEAGVHTLIEYVALGILLLGIYPKVCLNIKKYKAEWNLFIITMCLFSAGIILQDLRITRIIKLLLSMFILASLAIFPSNFIRSYKAIKVIGYGILWGIVLSTIIAICAGKTIATPASQGVFLDYGFNGGLEHRNYYSYTVIASFTSILISHMKEKRTAIDIIILFGLFVLLLISNSKSSYIIFGLLIFCCLCPDIRIPKGNRNTFFLLSFFICCIIVIPAFYLLTSISETFHFRANGLNNYLEVYGNDIQHLILGNAEMAFRDSGMSYDENIKHIIGWDGSLELVILNVLIKNGILGICAFILLFYKYMTRVLKIKATAEKKILIALICSFLLSSFVESYVANINYVYTVCMYSLIASILELNDLKSISCRGRI